jgi:RNA polymerase sigma-70 factor (ECF subfamily)
VSTARDGEVDHGDGPNQTVEQAKDGSAPLTEAEVRDAYERYGALMYRRCLKLLRDPAAADDAFQDAFVNIIKYGANYRSATAKLSWLYRVCQNASFQLLDRSRRRRDQETPREDIEESPSHLSTDYEDRNAVLMILARLEEKERELVVLVYLEGVKQGEAGRKLGWSRQTVNKKLQDIRSRAAVLLETTK